MENNIKKYDYKLIIISIILIVTIAIAFFFFWENTKNIIRLILEARLTYFLLWTLTVVIFVINYIKHKDKDVKSEIILTRKFGIFVDNALGGITYATIITTSLTLLKGLYIQQFFNDKQYFLEFKDLDLMTMFGVMLFLLYYAGVKVIDTAKETYKIQNTEVVYNENREIVKPIESEENNSN